MTTHIIIMVKQPLPGFAKTRLIPALGESGAASLAARMLQHAVKQAVAADIGPVTLNYTPNTWRVADNVATANLHLRPQADGDLGARMAAACQQVQQHHPDQSILLMGTDCPALTSDVLQQMHDALLQHHACLIPANDGGYVALAMREYNPLVFTDIHWSTDAVATTTRDRIQSLGWRCQEFPHLVDIDEPEDLPHLPSFLTQY